MEVRTSVARAWWTWVPNSAWVNDLRFGWDNSRSTNSASFDCTSGSGAPNYASMGFVSGGTTCGFPTVTITGFTEGTGTNVLGGSGGTDETSGLWRLLDNVSYTHGNHIFKFGGEFLYARLSISLGIDAGKGTINFNTSNNAFAGATALQNFFAGKVGSATIQTGTIPRNFTFPAYAWFAQDDWRILPRVTVNLGLRYEYTSPIHEADNLIGNIALGTTAGIVQAGNGTDLYKLTKTSLAPRFGLAWDVTGKGKTVVRTGFNIVYQNPSVNPFITPGAQLTQIPTGLNLVNGNTVVAPVGNITLHSVSVPAFTWAANSSMFGSFVGTNASCTSAAPCVIGGVASQLQYPMVLNWNFGIQHAINNNLTIEVGYVGNHGQHLLDFLDINQPIPNGANSGSSTKENAARPYTLNGQYPWFSQMKLLGGVYNVSNYNALQVIARQRASHGLTFLATYTYSHAMDTNSSDLGMLPPQDARNPTAEYGNSSYDLRHRVTFGPSYMIPGRKGYAQMLQGWQVTSTLAVYSGRPINPTDPSSGGDDLSATGVGQDRWTLVGNASDFTGFGKTTAIPCFYNPGTASGVFSSACTSGLPAACASAAAGEPSGAGGFTGTQSLNSLGCYMMGSSVIIPPAKGTFGTMGRFQIYGIGYWEWDASIIKTWKVKEKISTQFRAEFYNVTNSTRFNAPAANLASPSTLGVSSATPDVGVNSPIVGTGGPRKIQLGLKFIF
jgi:hypothetical protein